VKTRVTESLQHQGFGVITSIDLKDTFKNKLGIDFKRYTILGACNPKFAHKVVTLDSQLGLMLPCNVVVQEREDGEVEISAVNPMERIGEANPEITEVAIEVGDRLKKAINDVA
jgi:uncharacterized protein (DUF302 family)